MSNTIIKITEKGKASYGAVVCLPKAMIEMRDYSKVNPSGLVLTDSELAYAKAHGLDKVLADGLLAFAGMEKIGQPTAAPVSHKESAPKAVEAAKPAEEPKPAKPAVEHTEKVSLMLKEDARKKAVAKKAEEPKAPEAKPEEDK